MNSTTVRSLAIRTTLITFSLGLVLWGFSILIATPNDFTELQVVVRNASLPLQSSEYVVSVFKADSKILVAESANLDADVTILAPGDYDIHVKIIGVWPAQHLAQRDITLPAGSRHQAVFDFSYGELDVEVKGLETPGTDEIFKAQVFTHPHSDSPVPVIAFVPGDAIKLVEGEYDLRLVRTVHSKEKQIKWREKIAIIGGRQRDVAITFRRGTLVIIAKNVEQPINPIHSTVTIYRTGDGTRQPIESGFANLPMTLPIGKYDVRVVYNGSSDQPIQNLTAVEISENETNEVDVTFSSGELLVHAVDADGVTYANYDAYVYVYQPDNHRSAVAYLPAGQLFTLSAGRYDIRTQLFRSATQPDSWSRNVLIEPAALTSIEARFNTGTLKVVVQNKKGRAQIGEEFTITVLASSTQQVVCRMQIGRAVTLEPGVFDIKIENTYSGAIKRDMVEILANDNITVEKDWFE